ncbi:MAG: transposase [Candidatus Binatia bacterium]
MSTRGIAPWHAAAAVQGLTATGQAAGGRVTKLGRNLRRRRGEPGERESPTAAAVLGGLSLHAGVFIPATDRTGLEKLCRYAGRPALATARLESTADGRVLYRLRRPWRDRTSALVLERRKLMARVGSRP